MWSQLGVGLQQQNEDNDNGDNHDQQQSSLGSPLAGRMWSAFVQVATDVAQDLAQPSQEEEEDEGYYEGEGEEGWGEGVGGTQSWTEQQQIGEEQYYEEGREGEQYYEEGGGEDQYYEGGEDQYDEGGEEQYYEGGEEQYADEQYYEDGYGQDQGDQYAVREEGNGWGEEEEVDFGLEEDQYQQEQEQQHTTEQPLFVGSLEQLQQQPLTTTADDDQWDLEDEDIFDDADNQEAEQSQQPAEPQEDPPSESEPDGFLGDVVESNSGDNGWGQDETLNFDETQHAGAPAETPAEGVLDSYLNQEAEADVVQDGNAWGEDDIALDDEVTGANEPNEAVEVANATKDVDQADGWNDDFGGDESQHVDAEQGANEATIMPENVPEISVVQSVPEASHEVVQSEEDGWNDDLDLDEGQTIDAQQGEASEILLVGQESGKPAPITGGSTAESMEDGLDGGNDPVVQGVPDEGDGNGWNDDLDCLDAASTPLAEQKSEEPLATNDLQPTTASGEGPPLDNLDQTAQEAADSAEQGGWDDSFGVDDSQNIEEKNTAAVEPLASNGLAPPVSLDSHPIDDPDKVPEGTEEVVKSEEGWNDDDLGLDASQNLVKTSSDGKDEVASPKFDPDQAETEDLRETEPLSQPLDSVDQAVYDIAGATEQGGWDESFGFDDSQNIDAVEPLSGSGLEPPVPSDSHAIDDLDNGAEDTEAVVKSEGWNDDLGLDDSQNLVDALSDAKDELASPKLDPNKAETEDQAETEPVSQGDANGVEDANGGWGGDEDLNFSSHDEGVRVPESPGFCDLSSTPSGPDTMQNKSSDRDDAVTENQIASAKGVDHSCVAEVEARATSEDLPGDAGVSTEDAGAWADDDLDFNSQHEQSGATSQLQPPTAVDPDTTGEDAASKNITFRPPEDKVEPTSASQTKQLEVDSNVVAADAAQQEGNAWDGDDLKFSDHNDKEIAEGVVQPDEAVGKDNSAEPETGAEEDVWNDSGLDFDEDEDEFNAAEDGKNAGHELYVSAVPGTQLLPMGKHAQTDGGDDDSTVEQSNIGFEQTSVDPGLEGDKQPISEDADVNGAELTFSLPGRTPSRRATIRASNTSSACISRRDSEDDDPEPFNEKILGTSVMFADLTLGGKTEAQNPTEESTENTGPKEDGNAENVGTAGLAEAPSIRDTASSISDNSNNAELPKPIFETQISMMTLKSMADSCPSRLRGNDSDEDDEDKFGPVVDKTPEVSAEPRPVPELSTMTINSTAVVAHSINEDIQIDEDMEGTYYGGSTAAEGQSNENAWEEDDASSLGGLDLGEKIVNFEMSSNPIGGSAPQGESIIAPLEGPIQEEVAVTPPLNSSMAILYSDDNSVPSRDKDDDNEDDYKPVVDQVPLRKLDTEKSGRTLNSMTAIADNVGAMTIKESGEGEEENGWDDDGASLEDIDGVPANNDTTDAVVDNTPAEACSTGGKSGGSLAAVESADNSCPSRVHDSDEEVYGLVVDQIPTSPPPLMDQMSVAASSMAVIAYNVGEDLKREEDLDASDHGGSTIDGLGVSSWDNDFKDLDGLDDEAAEADDEKDLSVDTAEGPSGNSDVVPNIDVKVSPEGDRVVDLTPKMEGRKVSRLSSNSLAVLAHSVAHDFGDNDEDEDDQQNFGPIVDCTPTPLKTPSMTPNSTAVQASNIREDIRQDETTEGGVGDVNWDEECPELEDVELGEEEEEDASESEAVEDTNAATENTQTDQDQVVLVDHTPENSGTPRKLMGDASLAVLAPSEDGTVGSMNDDDDDDDIDPHSRERVTYGPVVDALPLPRPIPAPSTAPSVTFSLAVEARSVDEDFKLDDDMDETYGWEDDQTLDTLDIDQARRPGEQNSFKLWSLNEDEDAPLVDHTPQLNSPEPRMGDASLIAIAPSVASTYRSADAAANDDDTITQDEGIYGKVVDHTPILDPVPLVTSPSMAVEASNADFEDMDATLFGESTAAPDDGDGWGDDEKDLDELEAAVEPADGQIAEEALVDHTPGAGTEEKPKGRNVDPSVAVLAPSDDGSGEDDNDTIDGNHVFGPVVDMTPHIPSTNTVMSSSVAARHEGDLEQGTLFGDSTVGADTGWDEDDAALDDLVVDEKEDESADPDPSSANLWQSTELTSENASSHLEGSTIGKSLPDVASSQDGVVLVDHTPSEIDSSAQKNSVAWLVNVESGISGDETEDAGVSWRENDAPAGPNAQAEEDQVVDRIPQGYQSRYGDASTLVVADPSEVLSHVGDMLQEESDFGPVVDQTPPSRPGLNNVISEVGSTVVAAPTVAPDDLDADPDDAINEAEDNDGWEQDPSELEQTPNPQSGNEEPARVREQVVDFLPPQEEEEDLATDQNRDGWSEVATGGAPSVFQADPKEDEFGPVVDQLPALHPSTPFSAISNASNVASSECALLAGEDETEDDSKQERNLNVVVEGVEVALQSYPQDSTASLAHSLASEDEDDDGKYGPVVDHLPSIRSSLPPSRGGSTVDALATVSEVIDDDDDDEGDGDASSTGGGNDGWGDDDLGEIDISEHHETPVSQTNRATVAGPKGRADDQGNGQMDRGMTVRFRSVVAAIFTEPAGDTSVRNEETQPRTEPTQTSHDDGDAGAAADEPNAWDDDLDFDASLNVDPTRMSGNDSSILSSPERYAQFAEADTPPATPYSRPKQAHQDTNRVTPVGVALPDLTLAAAGAGLQCNSCANASTIDCPCVRRILKNKEEGDDDSIKIDYNKLLQTEISKRLLIEEESKDLRSQLETLKTSKTAGEVRMETVRTLQEHVKVIETKLEETRKSRDDLTSKNQELKKSIDQSKLSLAEWEDLQKRWTLRESTLREEAKRAAQELEESVAKANRAKEDKDQEVRAEKEARQEAMGALQNQLGMLQSECSSLRAEHSKLRNEIKEKQEEIQQHVAKGAAYEIDIKTLQASVSELQLAAGLAQETTSQYEALKANLTAKELAHGKLQSELLSLQQRVQASEADRNDEAKLTKHQHEEEIAKYQNDLTSVQVQLEEIQVLRIEERKEVASKLQELNNEVKKLTAERDALDKNARDLHSNNELASSEARTLLSQKESELESAFEQLGYLQEQNSDLEMELECLRSDSEKVARLEEEVHASNEENDTLVGALNEANENLKRLEQRIADQGLEESEMAHSKNREIESLVAERSHLQTTLAGNENQMQDLQSQLSSLVQENGKLGEEVAQLRSSCDHFQSTAEQSQQNAAETEENQTALIQELESLQQELASLLEERDEVHMEREMLVQRSKEMESSLSAAIEESDSNSERIGELEAHLSEAQREAMSLRDQCASFARERDQYLAKCQSLEQALGDSSKASQEVSRLLQENASLSDQARFVQQELENQGVVLQNFEARMAALEIELSTERDSNTAKDEELSELKRELEVTRANLEESAEGLGSLPQRIAELEAVVSRLEAERHELEQSIAMHNSREQEFREIADSLTSDRDAAMRDRDDIARENEEMLIHFGRLNEQMEELQQVVRQYEETSEVNDSRLLELQERLTAAESAQLERADYPVTQTMEDTEELLQLRHEQSRLIEEIGALTNTNVERETAIASITEELEIVRSELEAFEAIKANSAAVASENEQLRNNVDELEQQREELDATCTNQTGVISGLQTELGQMREGMSMLQSQVGMLEEACSNRDQSLQQKETEMRELLTRLHESSGSSSEATQEILHLRDRLNGMEVSGQATIDKLHALTASYEKSQEELVSSREQVSTLELSLGELEQELISKEELSKQQSENHTNEMYALQDKLQVKAKEVAELTKQSHELSMEVNTLQGSLEALQERLESKSAEDASGAAEKATTEVESLKLLLKALQEEIKMGKDESNAREALLLKEMDALKGSLAHAESQTNSLEDAVEAAPNAELESLKLRVTALQEEMESLRAESSTQEETLHSEMNDLRRTVASKEGEVVMLKHKVQSLSVQLGESITQVQTKEDELLKLASEMDRLRQEQENVHRGARMSAAMLLQQTKENAEDVENLRATVISLANALEASEARRADAIERLLRERETYADSLRHMSDSVKRFYNTLSCSD